MTAPRLPRQPEPGLSHVQTAGLLLALLAGLGVLYGAGVVMVAVWRMVGWMIWVPRG